MLNYLPRRPPTSESRFSIRPRRFRGADRQDLERGQQGHGLQLRQGHDARNTPDILRTPIIFFTGSPTIIYTLTNRTKLPLSKIHFTPIIVSVKRIIFSTKNSISMFLFFVILGFEIPRNTLHGVKSFQIIMV